MRHHMVLLLSLSHILHALCHEQDRSLIANDTSPADDQGLSLPALEPFAPTAKTAGPSGTLIQPKGGSIYKNHVGDVGNVEVIYKGVSDGTNDVGARTCTIDLHLVPVSGESLMNSINLSGPSVIHLSYGLRPHDSGSSQPIWANFVPPPGACGDFHLVVYERQLYKVRR